MPVFEELTMFNLLILSFLSLFGLVFTLTWRVASLFAEKNIKLFFIRKIIFTFAVQNGL